MNTTKHITDYLKYNADHYPDKAALYFENATYTWQELYHHVETAAQHIVHLAGNQTQRIIGLLLPNSDTFLITYLAVLHAGHIAAPLDPAFKAAEIQAVSQQLCPFMTITGPQYRDFFEPDENIVLATELRLTKARTARKLLRLSPAKQIATMLFTSGTTGRPKIVPYTHANHMWNPQAVSQPWQWRETDTILLSLPLSHWHGLVMGVDGALYHGNTIYLQGRFSVEETVKALESGKISLFMHVPIVYAKLVEYAAGRSRRCDISQVRLCISGSSYLPPRLWHDFKKWYGHDILERYGANEMGLMTSNRLDERIPASVGAVLPGVTITVQPDGELAMRSPGLFDGYWHNKEASLRQRTKDGLWLSGDIGEFDEHGQLHLKGRIQEKMKKLGYTVYPRDIEWVLMGHLKIIEAAVMSRQRSDSLDDEFVYFIVGDISDDELQVLCKQKMPSFWRPDRIIRLDGLPRTGRAQKPSLPALRQLLDQ